MSPTKKQIHLLANIWRYMVSNNISPSFSEVKEMMGVNSFQSVIDMLNRLESGGLIKKSSGEARSIKLTDRAEKYLMVFGVGQVLKVSIEVDGYSTNQINAQKFDSTQTNHNRAVANTSISYSSLEKPSIPQQMSLFDWDENISRSTETTNSLSNPSFNSVTIQWLGAILDSTSTTVASQAKRFVGPLVQFVVLKRLTSFSFSEIVLVVTLSLIILPFFINLMKKKYVTSN